MINGQLYDVIIIGGSYAGLSAAMALGRSFRQVLVLDNGMPANRQTPHAHNFITHDGQTPAAIAAAAKEQVSHYPTIQFKNETAVSATINGMGFLIETKNGEHFQAKKLLLATGITDIMPDIKGFAAAWGISVLHCPYCHGYEVRNEVTGILSNGEEAYEFSKMIHHWTSNLTIFTNGAAVFSNEQLDKLATHRIAVNDKVIREIEQEKGQVKQLLFTDGSSAPVRVLYARPAMRLSGDIPVALGCVLTATGHIEADSFQRTSVPGVFAAGDCTTPFRSLSQATAAGTLAGAMINKALVEEVW
ncbi:NAD(P)/FAD-dependent oxidoreductase [Chitinophaga sp. MM2321]|uniref:NAD(P)/FAD-dependent oxidoreductase n=1 Tax=Chitinophaga sp. MM2321 TaxID=3137178 RepID=UPI0032D5AC61